MTEILFVHGALVRDGDWWWRSVAVAVERATGIRSRAVALPSCGETDAAPGASSLHEDGNALHRALDDSGGGALVVGHSYGGTVIAEGAEHPAARHLLYISSYLPEVGISQGAIMSDEKDPVSIAPRGDGALELSGYDQALFSERFLNDVTSTSTRAEAWSRVTPQSAAAFVTPTTKAAWQGRESTYLVCTEDRSTSLALQRSHAARATRSIDVPTSHHPFLCRPDLVAGHVVDILNEMSSLH